MDKLKGTIDFIKSRCGIDPKTGAPYKGIANVHARYFRPAGFQYKSEPEDLEIIVAPTEIRFFSYYLKDADTLDDKTDIQGQAALTGQDIYFKK